MIFRAVQAWTALVFFYKEEIKALASLSLHKLVTLLTAKSVPENGFFLYRGLIQ